jgi:hypothetical protein
MPSTGPTARLASALLVIIPLLPFRLRAGEGPYFVTYDHQMEEPGNLETSLNPVIGVPKEASGFVASTTEFEYGVKGWWTTEFYLDAQSTRRDSTLFTGWRWENRFRPLWREHWINPVLYVEFEDINGADKTLKKVVGHDSEEDLATPNPEARRERAPDLHSPVVREAAPGTLFWFLKNGNLKEGMPSWSRLPDQQIWQLVSYLRTLPSTRPSPHAGPSGPASAAPLRPSVSVEEGWRRSRPRGHFAHHGATVRPRKQLEIRPSRT